MSGRLPTHLLVGALLRRANDAGGLAVVRARGDADAGALLIVDERGERLLERGIGASGESTLIESVSKAAEGESLDDYWRRRRARDPDLWVVALDIPEAERFVAETILLD